MDSHIYLLLFKLKSSIRRVKHLTSFLQFKQNSVRGVFRLTYHRPVLLAHLKNAVI